MRANPSWNVTGAICPFATIQAPFSAFYFALGRRKPWTERGPLSLAGYLWLIFLLYWLVSAVRVKATKTRESWGLRLLHLVWVALAIFLLFDSRASLGRSNVVWLRFRFVPDSPAVALIGLAPTAAGIAFAIWARWHLGKNWSAAVTICAQHELIRSGPYRYIRHPIYTGILLAMTGTALLVGEVRAFLAVAIVALSFFFKARKEEAWLAREFGQKFEAHTKHTGMFLPRFS